MGDKGEIEILLLPGLDGTGLLFADFVRECPPGIVPRVIEYPRDRFLGYRDLFHLVDRQLPQDSDFVILGESFSGPLAVMLAAERPRRLKAAVLAATFVTRPVPGCTGFLPWKTLFLLRPPDFVLRWLVAGPGADASLLVKIQEARRLVRNDVLAARVRAVLNVNVVEELEQIAVPVLYLQGAQDRLIRSRAVNRIRRAKPEVVVARIAAPHMVLQTAPRESWEKIVRFVRESASTEC